MTSNHGNNFKFEFPAFKNLYKMVFTNFIRFVPNELGFLAVKLKNVKNNVKNDVIITSLWRHNDVKSWK